MPKNADCPECEYCCLIGLCCPAEQQQTALVDLFMAGGSTADVAAAHAAMIVAAKERATKKGHGA